MTGLKRYSKYILVVVLPSLIGLLVLFYMTRKGDRQVLFSSPYNPTYFIRVDSTEYAINGISYTSVVIPREYEDCMVCSDTTPSCFYFAQSRYYSLINESVFSVDFIPDYGKMAEEMGRYTDNLSVHDNLYQLSLEPVLFLKYISGLAKKGGVNGIRAWFSIFYDNCKRYSSYKRGHRIDSLYAVSIERVAGHFVFAYKDAVSNVSYLIQDLPISEKKMGLYYYPTVFLGYDVGNSPWCIPILTGVTGSLYVIQGVHSFFGDGFRLIPEMNRYFKCVTLYDDTGTHPIDTYLSDTERLNLLIKQYYSSIE